MSTIMNQNNLATDEDSYNKYVEHITPTHNLMPVVLKAFLTGGIICALGQFISNTIKTMGLDRASTGAWTTLTLIAISIVLTGFNIYPKIVKFGGAGALVPITGFANAVVAPAIEYKKEGHIFGIGCKIFTISGPVILYGIFSSWILGIIYIMLQKIGLFMI